MDSLGNFLIILLNQKLSNTYNAVNDIFIFYVVPLSIIINLNIQLKTVSRIFLQKLGQIPLVMLVEISFFFSTCQWFKIILLSNYSQRKKIKNSFNHHPSSLVIYLKSFKKKNDEKNYVGSVRELKCSLNFGMPYENLPDDAFLTCCWTESFGFILRIWSTTIR